MMVHILNATVRLFKINKWWNIGCAGSSEYPGNDKCDLEDDGAGNVVFSSLKSCRDGYVDPLTQECVTNCGVGRYGHAEFTWRGTVSFSTCYTCDSSCYECVNGGANFCKTCPKGYYI
jgi:hypothetical protein